MEKNKIVGGELKQKTFSQKISDLTAKSKKYVKEHPKTMKVIGYAGIAAAGILVGYLLGKKRAKAKKEDEK